MKKAKLDLDKLGITASMACAIHCALLPLFLTSLPVFGVEIINNTMFEYIMIALACAIGFYSLYHGYKKHHHSMQPLIIFSTGILFLFAKQVFHSLHIWFLFPAVVLIITAHYVNFRLCKKANHCHADDCAHQTAL